MSRPVTLPAGVFVPADVCAELGPPLRRLLDVARRDRAEVRADVVEAIERVVLAGDAWRARARAVPIGTDAVPMLDESSSDVGRSETMTVRDAATTFGITERAVVKRIAAGTLCGRKVRGSWRVEMREER